MNKVDSETLAACPMCHGPARVADYYDGDGLHKYRCLCVLGPQCHAGPPATVRRQAVAAWNLRARRPEPKRRVKR